ncbi:hypothetical protein SAMN02983003_3123 [Devosia enhydra]|uniref:Uncharacterized protein n=1 Tax=Devosia enhydra TaxID=665118 RepID=A0A1K2I103_9HYPH|nr:hypothetical protein [Devosia enhydra]SFZ85951.1 hypothetical protein SAMN02983003_3123 [Devosia enhydra]
MTGFGLRALEMHSGYVWNYDRVRTALDFIARHEMNALVLHRNDIVDLVVYPGRTFGADPAARNIFERYSQIYQKLYRYTPTRRSGPYQRRDYLKRILELAARRGISVYFENKELYFADIFIELYPELTKNGTLCPSHPFWTDFLSVKYQELFEDLPGIAGIITAPGTGESRLAISSNRCTCEDCRTIKPQAWYRRLLMAMHAPIRDAGADLIVRDFVFDRKAQTELAETMESLPPDVIVSLKNTPHDYYPTFPENPRIGDVGKRRQWIEFDTMGQYFGWGVAPAILIEDYRRRLASASGKGAEGAIFRTDWESLDGHSSFANLNFINLYAGAALSKDNSVPAGAIHRRWLEDEGMLIAGASETDREAAAHWSAELFSASWPVVSKTLFVNDCVFSDSSNYPVSLSHAFWLAETKNSLKDWVPEKADALAATEDNIRLLLAEKDEALRLAEAMLVDARQARPAALSEAGYDQITTALEISALYVSGWRTVTQAILLCHYVTAPTSASSGFLPEARDLLASELGTLEATAQRFRRFAQDTDHRYVVYVMLGWERMLTLKADLETRIAAHETASQGSAE